jgi:hypothetical protein
LRISGRGKLNDGKIVVDVGWEAGAGGGWLDGLVSVFLFVLALALLLGKESWKGEEMSVPGGSMKGSAMKGVLGLYGDGCSEDVCWV